MRKCTLTITKIGQSITVDTESTGLTITDIIGGIEIGKTQIINSHFAKKKAKKGVKK